MKKLLLLFVLSGNILCMHEQQPKTVNFLNKTGKKLDVIFNNVTIEMQQYTMTHAITCGLKLSDNPQQVEAFTLGKGELPILGILPNEADFSSSIHFSLEEKDPYGYSNRAKSEEIPIVNGKTYLITKNKDKLTAEAVHIIEFDCSSDENNNNHSRFSKIKKLLINLFNPSEESFFPN